MTGIKPMAIAHHISSILSAVISTAILLLATPAHADNLSNNIIINQMQSTLQLLDNKSQWRDYDGQNLQLPITIKTGEIGGATISQGETSIELGKNTELELSSTGDRVAGFISLVKQKLGSAFYKVEKHPGNFRVETPYLVSVVKGTQFSIVSKQNASIVSVTEGLVEVRNLRSGELSNLSAGQMLRAGIGRPGTGLTNISTNAVNNNAESSSRIYKSGNKPTTKVQTTAKYHSNESGPQPAVSQKVDAYNENQIAKTELVSTDTTLDSRSTMKSGDLTIGAGSSGIVESLRNSTVSSVISDTVKDEAGREMARETFKENFNSLSASEQMKILEQLIEERGDTDNNGTPDIPGFECLADSSCTSGIFTN